MTTKHSTTSFMRRFSAVLALSLAILGLNAAPASAAPPIDFTDTVTFVDVNPCTGEDHTVTITFGVREKILKNGNVVVAEGFLHDDFGKEKLELTLDELRQERDAVKELGLI